MNSASASADILKQRIYRVNVLQQLGWLRHSTLLGTWTAVGDPIMFWIIISILTGVSLIPIFGLAILIHGKILGRLESVGSVG